MKNPKTMTYEELEKEVIANRCKLEKGSLEQKRIIIRRDHELMMEMDSRWNNAKN